LRLGGFFLLFPSTWNRQFISPQMAPIAQI
jgi:hypothetical protein